MSMEPLRMELVPLQKMPKRAPLLLLLRKMASVKQDEHSHQTEPADTLVLVFPASRGVKKNISLV